MLLNCDENEKPPWYELPNILLGILVATFFRALGSKRTSGSKSVGGMV